MKLTWYGHSAFKMDIAGASILIDPFLSDNPKWDGGWEDVAEGVTHVLLTHGHDFRAALLALRLEAARAKGRVGLLPLHRAAMREASGNAVTALLQGHPQAVKTKAAGPGMSEAEFMEGTMEFDDRGRLAAQLGAGRLHLDADDGHVERQRDQAAQVRVACADVDNHVAGATGRAA